MGTVTGAFGAFGSAGMSGKRGDASCAASYRMRWQMGLEKKWPPDGLSGGQQD